MTVYHTYEYILNSKMDLNDKALTWMPLLPRQPAVIFTFDLQNLIR